MCGEVLQHVAQQTYLGVELTKDLDWGPHIQKISAKANRTLNMVRRNLYSCPQNIKERAYIALVRPTLEYAHTVWDPYQKNHINHLEGVQRKAVRFVKGEYSRMVSVTEMRESLQWATLHQRRCVARLTMLHKAVNNESAVSMLAYFNIQVRSLRGQHDHSFINVH